MFVPIGDDNPLKVIGFQYVTVSLIVINVLVFLIEGAGGADHEFVSSFAVVPRELFQAGLLGGLAPHSADALAIPERATLLSYMFFHGDAMHLFGNMLFLWVFGDNVEDELGHIRFLFFYLACGVAAALLHALILPDSSDALIGASGAISGLIAAYLVLHPKVGIWVLVAKFIPLKITAAWALGAWIMFQLVMAFMPVTGELTPTAWWAHIGGLLAGVILIVLMRRPGTLLFGR
jgi:membrane associated rhomboid family serine protease